MCSEPKRLLRVEFTGCTGSGKSTLAREVRRELHARGVPVTTPFELVFGARMSRVLSTDSAQNFVLALISFPFAAVSCCRHAFFALPLLWRLLRDPAPPGRRLARTCSLLGKMGSHLLLGCFRHRPVVVLIDEGMLHSAHNTLAYSGGGGSVTGRAERFARNVPLNDRIVFVSASVEDIVARTLERPDPPVRVASSSELASFATKVAAMFELLERHPRIHERAIVVRCDVGAAALRDAAASVVRAISPRG